MGRDSARSNGTGSCIVSGRPAFSNPLLADIPFSSESGKSSSASPPFQAPSVAPSDSSATSTATSSAPPPRLQPLVPRRPPLPASTDSGGATLPVKKNFLQRLRRLDHETQLPSVRPFNHIILSFDFFEDIRDEVLNQGREASLPSSIPTRGNSPRSPSTPSHGSSAAVDGSCVPPPGPSTAGSSSCLPSGPSAPGRDSAAASLASSDGGAPSGGRSSFADASPTSVSDSSRTSASTAIVNLKEEFPQRESVTTDAAPQNAATDTAEDSSPKEKCQTNGRDASQPQEYASSHKREKQGRTEKMDEKEGSTAVCAATEAVDRLEVERGEIRQNNNAKNDWLGREDSVLVSKEKNTPSVSPRLISAEVSTASSTGNVLQEKLTSGPAALQADNEESVRGITAADEEDESDDEFSTRRLQPVPTNFSSVEHYVDTFFPLFLQEAKQAIQRAKKLEMGVSETYSQTQIKQEEEGDILLTLERPYSAVAGQDENEVAATVYTYNDLVLLTHPSIALQTASSEQRGAQQRTAQQSEIQDQQKQQTLAAASLNEDEVSAALRRAGNVSERADVADANATTAVLQQIHSLGIVQRAGIRSSHGEGQWAGQGASGGSAAAGASSSSGLLVRIINPEQLWKEKSAFWRSRDLQRQRQQKNEREESEATTDTASGTCATLRARSPAVEEGKRSEGIGGAGRSSREDLRRQLLLKARDRKRSRLESIVRYLCREETPTWNVRRIMNLTSLHREYQALMSTPDLHLIKELLCVKGSSQEQRDIPLDGSSRETSVPLLVAEGKEREALTRGAAVLDEKQQQQHERISEAKRVNSAAFASVHEQQQQQLKTLPASGATAAAAGAFEEIDNKKRLLAVPEGGREREFEGTGREKRKEEVDEGEEASTTHGKDKESSLLRHQKTESQLQGEGGGSTAAAAAAAAKRAAAEAVAEMEWQRRAEAPGDEGGRKEAASSEKEEGVAGVGRQNVAEEKKYFSIPPLLLASLQKMCNASQMRALQACLKYEGITLIQGPPGTGKTTTILALLSVLLNAQVRSSSSSSSRYVEGAAAGDGTQAQRAAEREKSEEAQQQTRTAAAARGPVAAAQEEGKPYDTDRLQQAMQKQQQQWQQLLEAQPWLSMGDYTPWEDSLECSFEDLELPPSLHVAAAERVLLDKTKTTLVPNRVLVCAPSNAAIDEIVKRIVLSPLRGGGILNARGQRCRPSVVRVGPNVRPDLLKFSLEYIAQQQLSHAGADLQTATLTDIKARILENQQVVCATLSACGSRDIARCSFDTIVIDEASQGVEVSTLIPLRLGCRRLILVGDPRQLPATIFSRLAILYRYDQSLFERLEAAGQQVNLLSVQYRMHPIISKFASGTFYQNQLHDAPEIEEIVQPPLPWYTIPLFKPLVFFSLNTTHQERNASFINVGEARFVCQLLDLISQMYIGLGQQQWANRVAVISPYAEQVFFLRREVKRLFGGGGGSIDINTVDGFQGQEKDLIIFCAVRAEEVGSSRGAACTKTTVGFLADERRINVALTRARANLWVVGNGRFLMSNHHWRCLWRYTKELGTLISIDEKYLQTEYLLKKWLLKFLSQNPAQKAVFQDRLPSFLRDIADEVKKSAAAHGKSLPAVNN